MQISVYMVGKTSNNTFSQGIEEYFQRLKHYNPIKQVVIPDLKDKKSLNHLQIKEKEAAAIIQLLPKTAFIVLLDEKGAEMRSMEFASFFQKQLNKGTREIIFIIGGAYGVADTLINLVDYKLSLSKMTFTHQFIRLILFEQIYRAFSILNNEPYHNE